MYIIKTPKLIKKLFPNYIWNKSRKKPFVYFTFDDGPIPEVTPWVLDTLKAYDMHGTFFCVGDNVRKHSSIYDRIINEGHSVGNHSYSHKSGWSTEAEKYLDDVELCGSFVQSNLYRPPYGRLRPQQAEAIRDQYKIVMWDILSGDFDQKITAEQCYQNVIQHLKPGSIIVFHDNIKSFKTLKEVLPKVIEYCIAQGLVSKALKYVPASKSLEKELAIA